MYSTYHMTDPEVFYNKEDLWSLPERNHGGHTRAHGARTTRSCVCPARRSEEFILMLPMVPKRRDNMIAWLAARCDGDNYGSVIEFRFPKDKLDLRPGADRGAHRSGHRDLAAALAVESDGLARDSRQPPGDPDRRCAALRRATLSERREPPTAGAQASDRIVRRPCRDEPARRAVARGAVRASGEMRPPSSAPKAAPAADWQPARRPWRRRGVRPRRRWATTDARSTSFAAATGKRSDAKWTS